MAVRKLTFMTSAWRRAGGRWSSASLAARLLAAAVAGLVCAGAAGAAEPAPLDRPALNLRQPQRTAMLGLAQAGGRIVAVGEHGAVLLSDDAGKSWRQAAQVPVSATLTAVQFSDERTGWAVGHYGVVLRSDDGGDHWTRQLDGHAIARLLLAQAQAQPNSNGNPKALADAQRAMQEGADKPLLTLHFVDARQGLVAGAFGLLLATQDGGKTWEALSSRLDNPKGGHLYAIDRAGDDLLIAGEQGLLLHSADGGQRFERISLPYNGSYFAVNHEAGGAWLVAGLRGNVLRSADGGHSWTALTGQAPVSVTSSLRDATGQLWLANQAGHLLEPQPGAATLALVASTAAQQPASLLRLADGSLLIAGWNGITRHPASPAAAAR